MNDIRGLNRRDILKVAGAGAGAAALGGVPGLRPGRVAAQAGSYEGVTLRALGLAGAAWNPAVTQFAQEFQEATGATVEWDFQPWEQTMPKLQADLAAGTAQYDLFCNDIEFQYTIYPSLQPIDELIAARGYNMEGFFEPIYTYGAGVAGGQEGVRYGLPIRVGASWVFYRTDLIPDFPTTWADYTAMLGELTGEGQYGLGFAGVPAQLVKLFLARFWSMGGSLLSADWQPQVNSEEGVAALQALHDAMTAYAPPGILAWDNPDASNAFLNGDVAVLEGWASFILPSLDDPDTSQVVDKWSVARYPEDGTGNFTQHNFAIFNTSQNIEAAFDYMAYCTGPETALPLLNEFKEESPRKTVWTDPVVAEEQPYLATVVEAYDVGRPFTPGLAQWLELFVGLAEGLSAAMSDQKSPQDALNDVAANWETVIAQAPPDWEYVG
jgi:ABC-type glycerol-3-phosphate transport system substrate-binding protein